MNFKKLLGVLLITFSSVFAAAETVDFSGHNSNPLLGNWRAINRIMTPDTDFQVNFRFSQGEVKLSVTCYFRDGALLSSSIRGAVSYGFSNAYDIYIQQAGQAVVSDGQRFCRATLQPSRWTAYFDGAGRMQLITQVPFNSQFILIRFR